MCDFPDFTDSYINNSNESINLGDNIKQQDSKPVSKSRHAILAGYDSYQCTHGIKVCHINSGEGGILTHFDSLVSLVDKYKPDVF